MHFLSSSRRPLDNTLYRKGTQGFTLIEVMIALGISGIALSSILLYVTELTDASAHIRDKTIARWIAEDRLAEVKLERRLSGRTLRGESSGRVTVAGTKWAWQVHSMPSPVQGLRRLEVSVNREELSTVNSTSLIELTGLLEE